MTYAEEAYSDISQLLCEASRDILKIMNDIEIRYLNRKREAQENKAV